MSNGVKSDKRQTDILIGVMFLVLALVFGAFAFMQPKVSNDYAFPSEETERSSPVFNSEAETYASANQVNSVAAVSDTDGKINLNTCTAAELTSIDSIGEVRANAIIAYREELGGYTSVEQIKNISGIGDGIYNSIAPYLTV